ncbi:hypothetical protein ERHA55_26210 [Erwinia rhapontici]|nr:hypothetical protein ERHA55_26210 [Erwinia rhapontici]
MNVINERNAANYSCPACWLTGADNWPWVTLPFLTIYLTEHYHLLPKSVGIIMGASLAIGIFSSLYGGYLVDKFSHRLLIGVSISLFASVFSCFRYCQRSAVWSW